MKTSDRKQTAYHEAGHAVAHIRLDIYQEKATIKRNPGILDSVEAEGKNHVWKDENAKKWALCYCAGIEDAEKRAICYCAGYAAFIVLGYSDEDAILDADDDMENAYELIQFWLLPGALDEWKQKSIALLSSPENIRAVEAIAKALLKYETLEWEYMEQLIELTDGNITEVEWFQFLSFRYPEILTG
jgi:hypothetical protein